MNRTHYQSYISGEISLADHLAIERTALASERTFLSFLRTMFGLFALGVGLLEISNSSNTRTAAAGLLISGFVIFAYGFSRYMKTMFMLSQIENQDEHINLLTFPLFCKNILAGTHTRFVKLSALVQSAFSQKH